MIKLLEFDESIFQSVVHSQAYFDSACFRLSREALAYDFPIGFKSPLLRELRNINGTGSVNLVEIPMPPSNRSGYSDWVLDIKQAKRETLLHLKRHTSHPLKPNGVEVARDFIFDTPEQAQHFERFLAQSMVQAYNSDSLLLYKELAYSKRKIKGERQPNRNMAIYSDQPARLFFGYPCCHLEIKYHGTENLKRIGITDLQSIIDFDFEDYFEKKLALYWVTEAGIRALVRRLQEWGVGQDSSLDLMGDEKGKVVDVSQLLQMRHRLVEDSSVSVGGVPIISAHNLKLTAQQWLSEVDKTKPKPTRAIKRRKKGPKKAVQKRVQFDKALFNKIDLSQLPHCENMLSESAGQYGDLSWDPNMDFYRKSVA
jgi:hypothetical protein